MLKIYSDFTRLYTYGAMTVRDVQHAIFNLGYSSDDLLRNCPKAPEGNEVDPSVRRMKAVLTHPIGDYAVQPREATFAAHGVTAAHYMNGGKSLRYATYLVAAALVIFIPHLCIYHFQELTLVSVLLFFIFMLCLSIV